MFKATQVVVGSVDWLLGLSGCFSHPVLLQVQPSSVVGTKAPTALVSSSISRLLSLSPYVCFCLTFRCSLPLDSRREGAFGGTQRTALKGDWQDGEQRCASSRAACSLLLRDHSGFHEAAPVIHRSHSLLQMCSALPLRG